MPKFNNMLFIILACILLVSSGYGCPSESHIKQIIYEYAPIGSTVFAFMLNTSSEYKLGGDLPNFFGILNNNATNMSYVVVRTNITRDNSTINGPIYCLLSNTTKNISLNATVYVNSINLSPPVFDDLPSVVNVNETDKVGTVILSVSASDADGFPVVYSCQDTSNSFKLEGNKVYIEIALDYRRQKSHLIIITATSNGFNNTGGTWIQTQVNQVTVEVLNNDLNPPSFFFANCSLSNSYCGVYQIQLYTTKLQNLTVLPNDIKATDLDPNNASMTYQFVWGDTEDYASYFFINHETGLVYMNQSIGSDQSFLIVVEAMESTGKTSTANLYIEVQATEEKLYPEAVVHGLIGGFVSCFVILGAISICAIVKLRNSNVTAKSEPDLKPGSRYVTETEMRNIQIAGNTPPDQSFNSIYDDVQGEVEEIYEDFDNGNDNVIYQTDIAQQQSQAYEEPIRNNSHNFH